MTKVYVGAVLVGSMCWKIEHVFCELKRRRRKEKTRGGRQGGGCEYDWLPPLLSSLSNSFLRDEQGSSVHEVISN